MNYRAVKRVFDLFSATFLLLLLMPLLLFIIIVCFFVHGWKNIFFLQERVGRYGHVFKVIKFKTMTDEKDETGKLLPDENRQTTWGCFMRKASLDELLQLINVIKGDMSLIGPRPLIEEQIIYAKGDQLSRFEERPGISGLAQVCGRNDLQFNHRFRYDEWYVKNMCPGLDLYIILMTFKVVLKGHGVDYNPEVKTISEAKRNATSL